MVQYNRSYLFQITASPTMKAGKNRKALTLSVKHEPLNTGVSTTAASPVFVSVSVINNTCQEQSAGTKLQGILLIYF